MLQAVPIPDYQQIYAVKFMQPITPTLQPLSPAAAAHLYHCGLDAAANTAMAGINSQNRQRRGQLQQELSQHLHSLPYGTTMANCSPEDLLVFMQAVYIPRHAGTILPDGECIAAPSSIKNTLSHLRMAFKEVGRGNIWDSSATAGNPAASHQLHQWCTGHEKISLTAGFRSTSAVAMRLDTIKQLLGYLLQRLTVAGLSSYEHALAARDGLAFCLMWQTGMRSVNAREIKLSDFLLPGQARGSLQAHLHQHGVHSHPGIIQVHPERTKTHLQNPFLISIPLAAEPVLDTYYWLTAVMATACLIEQPITEQLIRSTGTSGNPRQRSSPCFSEQALSRPGLHSRLVSQLKAIDAYNGESLHSFRRGMAQYLTACGQPAEQTMAQMLLQTKRVLDTVYLPMHRQHNGIKRLRCVPDQATPSML